VTSHVSAIGPFPPTTSPIFTVPIKLKVLSPVAFLRSSCVQPPLLIRSHNDILACNGRINHRFTCREESHEAVVENAGGDEGVDVADCETGVEVLAL
jgi:hypothetical protein